MGTETSASSLTSLDERSYKVVTRSERMKTGTCLFTLPSWTVLQFPAVIWVLYWSEIPGLNHLSFNSSFHPWIKRRAVSHHDGHCFLCLMGNNTLPYISPTLIGETHTQKIICLICIVLLKAYQKICAKHFSSIINVSSPDHVLVSHLLH